MNGGRWISHSRHEKFEISTSRFPLESWDLFSKFLFSKLEKIADVSIIFCKNSCSLLEPENRYLFSSWNSRCGFHISLYLLDLTFWHLVNAWCHVPWPSRPPWPSWHSWHTGILYLISLNYLNLKNMTHVGFFEHFVFLYSWHLWHSWHTDPI